MTTNQSLLRCTKEVKTKSGLKFNEGEYYSFIISSKGVRVWVNSDKSILIENEKTLDKYFK